jgi:hypothetical protein
LGGSVAGVGFREEISEHPPRDDESVLAAELMMPQARLAARARARPF